MFLTDRKQRRHVDKLTPQTYMKKVREKTWTNDKTTEEIHTSEEDF